MTYRKFFCASLAIAVTSTAHADVVGDWCDTMIPNMKRYDAVITIKSKRDGGYELVVRHGDGSSSNTHLVKSGEKFMTNNDFGEYYQVRQDNSLAIYDNEGFVRSAKAVESNAKPGKCR